MPRRMNQHGSLKGDLLILLQQAREHLKYARTLRLAGASPSLVADNLAIAQVALGDFWQMHAQAPRSTQRRWGCGQ